MAVAETKTMVEQGYRVAFFAPSNGELERLAEAGQVEEVRRALFDLVSQIRGDKPGVAPTLRVVANR